MRTCRPSLPDQLLPNALGGFEHPPLREMTIRLDVDHNPTELRSSPSRDCSAEYRRQTFPVGSGIEERTGDDALVDAR